MPEPTIARKAPFPVDLEPGTYYWCACGKANGQPFCDGAHAGTGFEPVVVDVKDGGTRYFCGCKHTIDEPFCDGTHREL